MRVCFVGYGSIAKRHICNMKALYGDECIIDVLRHSPSDTGRLDCVDQLFYDWSDIKTNYEAIFITNPTVKHFDTLKIAVNHSKNVFIEKPVFDDFNKSLDEIKLAPDGVYYVACPLRYTRIIDYLKNNINFGSIYSLRAISSSYLPDWRKTDYRDTYSARKDLGGGVALDLVHEWDYISYLIGYPLTVSSIIRRKSDLEIDSDDTAIYIADYKDKVVELHLDYYGRKPIRKLELYGKDDTIVADFIAAKITWLNEGKEILFDEARDDYQKRELRHFFDIVDGKIKNDSDIAHALKILQIAKGE